MLFVGYGSETVLVNRKKSGRGRRDTRVEAFFLKSSFHFPEHVRSWKLQENGVGGGEGGTLPFPKRAHTTEKKEGGGRGEVLSPTLCH